MNLCAHNILNVWTIAIDIIFAFVKNPYKSLTNNLILLKKKSWENREIKIVNRIVSWVNRYIPSIRKISIDAESFLDTQCINLFSQP